MKKIQQWVKNNKKIIILLLSAFILMGAIFIINQEKSKEASIGGASETEKKLIAILEKIDGVGETKVMINENDHEIAGVVIVCEGANNLLIRHNIITAVSTALHIDKNYIAIYEMAN